MTTSAATPDERRRLKWARRLIYLAPILAGLLTVCVMLGAPAVGLRLPDEAIAVPAFAANTLAAGVASAWAVVRLHPVQRGKWWRAGASFLFALPMSFASAIFFASIAGCAGLLD